MSLPESEQQSMCVISFLEKPKGADVNDSAVQMELYNKYLASLSSYMSGAQALKTPVVSYSSSGNAYQQQQQQTVQQPLSLYQQPYFQGLNQTGVGTGQTFPQLYYGSSTPNPNSSVSRTIYLGNVPPQTKPSEIVDLIKCGLVVELKILPEKHCAFIEFPDQQSSMLFYSTYAPNPPALTGNTGPLRISFTKTTQPLAPHLQAAISTGATRVVYVSGLTDDQLNEGFLESKFSVFGNIESIRLLREKKTAFVHYTSIASAMKVVSSINSSNSMNAISIPGVKVAFGKDRCAGNRIPLISCNSQTTVKSNMFLSFCNQNPQLLKLPGVPAPFTDAHRNIFVGSLPPETNLADLANAVRGGPLYNLKLVTEKNCAFITFIHAIDALYFYRMVVGQYPVMSNEINEDGSLSSNNNTSSEVPGIFIRGRKIYKVGFGKSIQISPSTMDAIEKGNATRNLYIGFITQAGTPPPTEAQLLTDFGAYGAIESVHFLPEKSIAFINFANLLSAMKALAGIKANSHYSAFKVLYGKDRCAGTGREHSASTLPPFPNSISP